MTSLSVLVPVYNEQFLVAESLARLKILETSPHLERIEVIVVDDCSRDDTPAALERFRAALTPDSKIAWIFLKHEKNGGKGKAIQTALEKATCEITVIHDADLEYHPRDLLRVVRIFVEEEADAVFGSRFAGGEARRVLLYRHQLGNKFLTFLTNLVTNLNLTDMETCYKAVRTELLKSIPIVSNDFRLEPELTIKLGKRSARIFEVPISYSGRTYAEGKKISWKDGFAALWAIARFAVSDSVYRKDEYGSQILARMSRAPRFNAWMAPKCGCRFPARFSTSSVFASTKSSIPVRIGTWSCARCSLAAWQPLLSASPFIAGGEWATLPIRFMGGRSGRQTIRITARLNDQPHVFSPGTVHHLRDPDCPPG